MTLIIVMYIAVGKRLAANDKTRLTLMDILNAKCFEAANPNGAGLCQ